MKKITIQVPDNTNDMPYTVMNDGHTLCILFDLEQEQAQAKPHKHAESIARFQKDAEEHGEAWAIDHWQYGFSEDHHQYKLSGHQWQDCIDKPAFHHDLTYRRVIKIGNRKVSEPVTELKLWQEYFYPVFYDACICSDKYESQEYENGLLQSRLVRLTEQDAQELHNALLAVLTGE